MRTYRRLISLLCTLTTLISVCVACRTTDTEIIDTNTNTIETVTITDYVDITTELAQCYVKSDLLRIECIQPNLDTYSLSVILYSLSEHKVLSTIELGEDMWQTGWTTDGFYAASLSTYSIRTFDSNGQTQDTLTIPNHLGAISLFSMNESADTYFLGVGEQATLYLFDIPTASAKEVGKMPYGYSEMLPYRDGYFYFSGQDDLLRIHEDSDHAETVYCNSQSQTKFLDMGIQANEDSFILTMSADNREITVIKQYSSEYPKDADATHFVTFSEEEQTLRVYNLSAQTVQSFAYANVQQVVLASEYMLVSTRNEGQQTIHWVPIANAEQNTHTFVTHLPTTTTTIPSTVTTGTSASISQLNPHIIDAPLIPQFPNYPTGCESVSAVMLLNYWGEDISVDTFIDDYLPKSSYFHSKDGIYYGPNPYEYFIGNPRTEQSYGCMSPVIQHAINSYYGENSPLKNVSGLSLPELCNTYIANNQPVLVWVTIGMVETYTTAQWRLEDGTLYAWPANEHCMLLVGFDEKYYYFNDPYTGKVKKYAHWICEDRYTALGSQALVIVK